VLNAIKKSKTIASLKNGVVKLFSPTAVSGLLRVNCEAELRVTCNLIEGIQNLLLQKPYEGAETDSRAKFGKEIVAGAHRRLK
jgi:hypothetical protein